MKFCASGRRSIAAAGERCIEKVVLVQETEYDDVIECKHSYSERCHTTYTTDYQPQQVKFIVIKVQRYV